MRTRSPTERSWRPSRAVRLIDVAPGRPAFSTPGCGFGAVFFGGMKTLRFRVPMSADLPKRAAVGGRGLDGGHARRSVPHGHLVLPGRATTLGAGSVSPTFKWPPPAADRPARPRHAATGDGRLPRNGW